MASAWTRLLATIDPVARALGAYTAYTIHDAEYVGSTRDIGLRGARYYLRDNGYDPHYLAAAKRHPESGALHDLGYRRVPSQHPDAVTGTVIQGYDAGACQYHVHVFRSSSGVLDWFSHYETRPLCAPREHYSPTPGETYLRGLTDLDV